MSKRWSTIALLIGVQLALGALFWMGERTRSSAGPVQSIEPWVGPPVELGYREAGGATHRLGELRGRVILLAFWASYCPGCRTELPLLLGRRLPPGTVLLPLSLDESVEPIQRATGLPPLPGPYLASAEEARTRFGVESLPAVFLIGKDGRPRFRVRHPGETGWPRVREILEALCRE